MAVIRETVASFRIYLFLAGTFGGMFHLSVLSETERNFSERAMGLIGTVVCALLLCLGVTLSGKLRSQIGFVYAVLWGLIGFNMFLLADTLLAVLLGMPTSTDVVTSVIGILIGWYLLVNARRLHTELMTTRSHFVISEAAASDAPLNKTNCALSEGNAASDQSISLDRSQPSPESRDLTDFYRPLRWPWGQINWCLTGVAFSTLGVSDLAVLLKSMDASTGEVLNEIATLLFLAAITGCVPAVILRRLASGRGEPLIHLCWLRRVNYGLLVAVILFNMLPVMISAFSSVRMTQSQAMVAMPWHDHLFANGSVQVSTPANWELIFDPTLPNSAIRLSDRQNDLHLIGSLTPKQDLTVRTLTELSQQSLQALIQDASNVSFGEIHLTEVESHSVADRVLEGTFNGVNLVCSFRHLDYSDDWVELRLWTTRSHFQTNEELFAQIAASIHRKN